MNSFVIKGCDFGIDPDLSAADLRRELDGSWFLTLDIHGSPKRFAQLASDEGSGWSWALYPPRLYAHGIPIAGAAWNEGSVVRVGNEPEIEMAIYMMEHNDIHGLAVRNDAGRRLLVSGRASFSGEIHPFSISFEVPLAGV